MDLHRFKFVLEKENNDSRSTRNGQQMAQIVFCGWPDLPLALIPPSVKKSCHGLLGDTIGQGPHGGFGLRSNIGSYLWPGSCWYKTHIMVALRPN